VKISSRASSFARSSPTPQTAVTGAASGKACFSDDDIVCTIQIAGSNLNHGNWHTASKSALSILFIAAARVICVARFAMVSSGALPQEFCQFQQFFLHIWGMVYSVIPSESG